MKRRCLTGLLGALIVGVAASCNARAEQPAQDDAVRLLELPVLPGTGPDAGAVVVEAFCSETIPSFEVATLTWKSRTRPDDRQRIDLTVYSNGFELNRYATLWPLKHGQRPRALRMSKLRPEDPSLVPRLKSLYSDSEKGSSTVRLEGLEGGLIYTVRIVTFVGSGWMPGPVGRFPAPVCITEP